MRKFEVINDDNLYFGETGELIRESKAYVLLKMTSTGFNEEEYFSPHEVKELEEEIGFHTKVEELLSGPAPSNKYQDTWWDVKVSYYDNEHHLRTRVITLPTIQIAQKFKKGYPMFLPFEKRSE